MHPRILVLTLTLLPPLQALGDATPSVPFPTPSSGASGTGGAGSQLLSPATEPAITLLPFNGGQRAVVFANGNQFATYDIVDGSFHLVASGAAPNPESFTLIGDPVAVTQGTTAYIGAVAWRGDIGPEFTCPGSPCEGLIVVWRSTDGVNWSNPIVVAEYFQEVPPYRAFADKPWMDVSRISGRLWMVWRTFGLPDRGPCISTSLDGVAWSGCLAPASRSGFMSVAVDGPHSAVAIWDRNEVVKSSRCTADGLAVTCGPVQDVGPRIDVGGGELIPGLKAGALFTIAGDDASGRVMAVWGEEDQPEGLPTHARVVWSESAGGAWSIPQPITAPTDDQIMPEVAYAGQPGEFFVTLYQRQGTSTSFDVVAYQREKLTGNWVSLGTVGNPVSANMDPMFFGDYSWAECPNVCAVAFTGTNVASTPNLPQIELELVGKILPTGDTYVVEEQAAVNYGLAAELSIGTTAAGKGSTSPYRRRILMDFDISAQIPNGATNVSAMLLMYQSSDILCCTTRAMVLYRNAVTEVAEETVTWNTQPNVESFPAPIVWNLASESGWTALDVTDFVLSCRSFQAGKCSWQLRWLDEVDNVSTADTFQSRDHPVLDMRPYLEIHYDIP